jgi:hypothetical protein
MVNHQDISAHSFRQRRGSNRDTATCTRILGEDIHLKAEGSEASSKITITLLDEVRSGSLHYLSTKVFGIVFYKARNF